MKMSHHHQMIDLTASSPVASDTTEMISLALATAIKALPLSELQTKVLGYCERHADIRSELERELLVQAEDVKVYNSDEEDENLVSLDGFKMPSEREGKIAPRYATCQNCEQRFDVTDNGKEDCIWHPGEKNPDYESDFWADHDEDCHGIIADFADDPDFEEGFLWDCCEMTGGNEGCRTTRHKAAIIMFPDLERKRKATEDLGSVRQTRR